LVWVILSILHLKRAGRWAFILPNKIYFDVESADYFAEQSTLILIFRPSTPKSIGFFTTGEEE